MRARGDCAVLPPDDPRDAAVHDGRRPQRQQASQDVEYFIVSGWYYVDPDAAFQRVQGPKASREEYSYEYVGPTFNCLSSAEYRLTSDAHLRHISKTETPLVGIYVRVCIYNVKRLHCA